MTNDGLCDCSLFIFEKQVADVMFWNILVGSFSSLTLFFILLLSSSFLFSPLFFYSFSSLSLSQLVYTFSFFHGTPFFSNSAERNDDGDSSAWLSHFLASASPPGPPEHPPSSPTPPTPPSTRGDPTLPEALDQDPLGRLWEDLESFEPKVPTATQNPPPVLDEDCEDFSDDDSESSDGPDPFESQDGPG